VCTSPKNVQMLFWDLETKQLIQDVRGISRVEKIANLEISCVSYLTLTSLSEIETAEVTTLWFDAETGFAPLLDAFDKATKIVSYNGICFDHLVLKKHYEDVNRHRRHEEKVHDVFDRLREATGTWFKLDALLENNNLAKKEADGIQAVKWFAEGKRELLQSYCESDVRALARLTALPELKLPSVRGSRPGIVKNWVFGVL